MNFLRDTREPIIFGTHNQQTLKHNTLINKLLLMQFYLINVRPKLHHRCEGTGAAKACSSGEGGGVREGYVSHSQEVYRLWGLTHSLTAARNRLWVVAPFMLTGRRRVPMRQQQ